jgi:hypothetical protein
MPPPPKEPTMPEPRRPLPRPTITSIGRHLSSFWLAIAITLGIAGFMVDNGLLGRLLVTIGGAISMINLVVAYRREREEAAQDTAEEGGAR